MLKAKDGDFFVTDWLRSRNTMEFLGVWERIYNPNFNYGEFATIRNRAGLNSIKISVKEFVPRTNGDKGQIPVTFYLRLLFKKLSLFRYRFKYCYFLQYKFFRYLPLKKPHNILFFPYLFVSL